MITGTYFYLWMSYTALNPATAHLSSLAGTLHKLHVRHLNYKQRTASLVRSGLNEMLASRMLSWRMRVRFESLLRRFALLAGFDQHREIMTTLNVIHFSSVDGGGLGGFILSFSRSFDHSCQNCKGKIATNKLTTQAKSELANLGFLPNSHHFIGVSFSYKIIYNCLQPWFNNLIEKVQHLHLLAKGSNIRGMCDNQKQLQ